MRSRVLGYGTLATFVLLALGGCSSTSSGSSHTDSGVGSDSATADSSAADSGTTDSGEDTTGSEDASLDSGLLDSGTEDTGFDSGTEDTGFDSGAEDSGLLDSGAEDSGALDSAPADSSPPQDSSPADTSVADTSVPSDTGTVVETGTPDAPPATFAVGGTVTGLTGTLVLLDNGGDSLSVTASGSFTFATKVATNAAYAVTVGTQPSGQTCTVTGGSGTVAAANVTSVAVACVPNSYTVGGMLTGLVAGDTVVLQDNGGDPLSLTANGAFTFTTPVTSGQAYAVTVLTQPGSPTESCVVSAGTGTINGGNASSVVVNCTPATFTVGGTIAGLAGGDSLALTDNGGDTLFVTSNGAFAFATPVAAGSAYAVAIAANPATPTPQVCKVTNGAGTVAAANVTSVSVTCTTSTSCNQIHTSFPSLPSGSYNIAAGGSAFGVYCDMTDNGGGWTLVAKLSGLNDAALQTWSYDQPIWTNNTTLNPSSTDISETEAKFLSYSTVPFTNILGVMAGASPLVIPVADTTSFQHLMSGGTVTTTLGRQSWLNLTTPTATPQLNCNAEGINQTAGAAHARVRIGLLTNGAANCTAPGSATGFGIETAVCGDAFGPAAGSAGGSGCAGGGADVLDFGYLYVR